MLRAEQKIFLLFICASLLKSAKACGRQKGVSLPQLSPSVFLFFPGRKNLLLAVIIVYSEKKLRTFPTFPWDDGQTPTFME